MLRYVSAIHFETCDSASENGPLPRKFCAAGLVEAGEIVDDHSLTESHAKSKLRLRSTPTDRGLEFASRGLRFFRQHELVV